MCFNTVYPKWNPFPSFITLCSSERPKFYVNIIYSVSRGPKCGVIWNTSIVPSPHQIVSLYSISYWCQIVPVIKLLERSVCIFSNYGLFLSGDRRYVQEWDCWIIWYLIFSFLRKFSSLINSLRELIQPFFIYPILLVILVINCSFQVAITCNISSNILKSFKILFDKQNHSHPKRQG